MSVTPAAGPSCAGLPAQTPESSLPGLQGPPQRPSVSRPSWVVRTEPERAADAPLSPLHYRSRHAIVDDSREVFVHVPLRTSLGLQGQPRRPSVSKPSWVVRAESNVRRERPKPREPPCTICKGTGAIDCHICSGRGRVNHVNLVMLPKGEWPQWCKICGGSGLDYCHRCHGTGEYREPMGFHFTVNTK